MKNLSVVEFRFWRLFSNDKKFFFFKFCVVGQMVVSCDAQEWLSCASEGVSGHIRVKEELPDVSPKCEIPEDIRESSDP